MHTCTASYRLQFNASFGFGLAKKVVPYLSELGITDIYASPIFQSKKGSLHGYDVVDPTRLNDHLGTEKEFKGLIRKTQDYSMGWIQDIVPNHMAFDSGNYRLMDVFEKGRRSPYFSTFDIEWGDSYAPLKRRVLAPFLGRFYSQCLEDQEIQLKYDKSGFSVNYYDLKYPLKIETYLDLLSFGAQVLENTLKATPQERRTYSRLLRRLKNLSQIKNKNKYGKEAIAIKDMLWQMRQGSQKIKKTLHKSIKIFNGQRGKPESFSRLDQLLSKQLFRLSFWKFGTEEINYRRFFNINQLISVRVEDTRVFNETHRFIFGLIKEKLISGIRIDHIDGLYHPLKYLNNLRKKAKDNFIVVEKILDFDEKTPDAWPVEGTTGYDFLNMLNGLFCYAQHKDRFDKIYTRFTGLEHSFEELISMKKRLIIGKHMAGEVDNLAHHMKRVFRNDRYGRDITLYGLKRALVEVLAFFPVYRTYIDSNRIREYDRLVIQEALKKAREAQPGLLYELNYIENALLINANGHISQRELNKWTHFVMRFQQFTGPLMAKGFEDTVLYIYNRLTSLNEVGSSPDKFGIDVNDFHSFNRQKANFWPQSLNATATHDTKRGEDIRARINVLSEIPDEWSKRIQRWQKMNKKKKIKAKARYFPDNNDEYFLYQTLIGGWPYKEEDLNNFLIRLRAYVIKAVREAKVYTAWLKPDQTYEKAYMGFLNNVLKRSGKNVFLKDFLAFQKRIAFYGIFNSLSQTLIKMTAPGIPDFYQGTELWDFHFVDPDNREAVNFKKRIALLKNIRKEFQADPQRLIEALFKSKEDGRIKLFLIWRVLKCRKEYMDLFRKGRYVSLQASGPFKNHVIAFYRKHRGENALILAPRFLSSVVRQGQLPVGHVWKNTRVPLSSALESRKWVDYITGEAFHLKKTVPIKEVFRLFPGAVLIEKNETTKTR